jgi:hypothetical protein
MICKVERRRDRLFFIVPHSYVYTKMDFKPLKGSGKVFGSSENKQADISPLPALSQAPIRRYINSVSVGMVFGMFTNSRNCS